MSIEQILVWILIFIAVQIVNYVITLKFFKKDAEAVWDLYFSNS